MIVRLALSYGAAVLIGPVIAKEFNRAQGNEMGTPKSQAVYMATQMATGVASFFVIGKVL